VYLNFLSFENILDSAVMMGFECFPANFRRHETEKITARRQDAFLEEHKSKMMQELAAPFDFGPN
jgi:hypothetical protein